MNRIVYTSAICLSLLLAQYQCAAQRYEQTPVTISTETVTVKGKTYYSHVVLERQTLYTISKAYGVSIQDIYDANEDANLEKEGIKKFQIIRIPVKNDSATDTQTSQEQFTTHIVKWYEDLKSIAKKYNVRVEVLMEVNGLKDQNLSKQQTLRIPSQNYVPGSMEDLIQDSDIAEAVDEAENEVIKNFSTKNEVIASLILPFNAAKSPSENHLEFYSGVLLAIHDLEAEGIHTELNVFDSSDADTDANALNGSDVIIGPVSLQQLEETLAQLSEDIAVVSPLEPRAISLAESHSNFIQAPAPSQILCLDLIDWMESEFKKGDKVVLVTEKNGSMSDNAKTLSEYLDASDLEYAKLSYTILEGAELIERLEPYAAAEGRTHFLLASENEAFANDFIRNLNVLAHMKYDVALYCTSKIRSFETIEVQNLHSVNMHSAISYSINYDSKNVQNFLMEYRALFNAEPGPFAYQGYDLAKMFIGLCSQYGSAWEKKLNGHSEKGLQSSFRFVKNPNGGYTNKAVRRILYGPDFYVKQVN